MKVQLAKLKAEQEKSGKKAEHKVSFPSVLTRPVPFCFCPTYSLHCWIPRTELTISGELQNGRSDVGFGSREPRELSCAPPSTSWSESLP